MNNVTITFTPEQFNQIVQIITTANAPYVIVNPLVQTMHLQAQKQIEDSESAVEVEDDFSSANFN